LNLNDTQLEEVVLLYELCYDNNIETFERP
jgi:hypothetical protein